KAAAPRRAASRQAAPGSTRTTTPVTGTVQGAARNAAAVKSEVRAAVTKGKPGAGASPPTQPVANNPASANCGGLPIDGILPASLGLGGLLSIACSAADILNPAGANAAGDTTLPPLSLTEVLD